MWFPPERENRPTLSVRTCQICYPSIGQPFHARPSSSPAFPVVRFSRTASRVPSPKDQVRLFCPMSQQCSVLRVSNGVACVCLRCIKPSPFSTKPKPPAPELEGSEATVISANELKLFLNVHSYQAERSEQQKPTFSARTCERRGRAHIGRHQEGEATSTPRVWPLLPSKQLKESRPQREQTWR